MTKPIKQAVEEYFAAAREGFSKMEKPTRLWHSPIGGGNIGTTAQPRTDYWKAARDLASRLHSTPQFEALIAAIASDESLTGSPAAANARKYWDTPAAHAGGRSTQRAYDLVDGFVTIPLVGYLEAADNDALDGGAAKKILERLIDDLRAHSFVVRRTVPLTNLLVAGGPHEIALGVVVRSVERKDLENWLNGDDLTQWGGIVMPGHPDVLMIKSVADITIEAEGVTAALRDKPDATIERLLVTLRLATGKRVDAPFWEEQVAGMPTVHRPISIRPIDLTGEEEALLDATTAQDAGDLWSKLEGYPDSKTASVAIRRYNDAAARTRADDRLIDYWIALESLFNPKKSTEIQFRATYRIGAYVGTTSEERLEIFHFMRRSYNRRSEVAHGAVMTDVKESTEDVAERTGEILRRALLKVLAGEELKPEGIEIALLRRGLPGGEW